MGAYDVVWVDSVLRFTNRTGTGDSWRTLIEEFSQKSVDLEILKVLKRDTLNYKLLFGSWELEHFLNLDDGSEPMELSFPIALPDELNLSPENLDTAVSKQVIRVKIGQEERPFWVLFLNQYAIELIPYHWDSGPCPYI